MVFEHYIYAGTTRLRCGYTTGTCAALAAKAATQMLLEERKVDRVAIITPAGIPVEVDVMDAFFSAEQAHCAVCKDSGDDADCTDGILVYAQVGRCSEGIAVTGGPGVGRVTRSGLEQPVGAYAINRVPRQMIRREVAAVCRQHGYAGGMQVCISVPGGERAAAKTFNPKLGIEGGISILGTSGIVEPKSVTALLDSIELEIRQRAELGETHLVLTPGNYGRDFIGAYPGLEKVSPVCCSNYLGETLDLCVRYGMRGVLLAGHIGKLVKVAGGIMNTHSRVADCRVELICAHAAAAGISPRLAGRLLAAATTDACLDLLAEADLLEPVLRSLAGAIEAHLQRRCTAACKAGALVFSGKRGLLCETPGAGGLLLKILEERGRAE